MLRYANITAYGGTLNCKHCGKPITHSDHPLTKSCNRTACIKARDTKQRNAQRAKKQVRFYHCIFCGRRSDMPAGTPKNERICKHCRKYLGVPSGPVSKIDKDLLCGCCHTRIKAYWLDFRKLCYPCWENDGNPDEEKQRGDTLDHRYIQSAND